MSVAVDPDGTHALTAIAQESPAKSAGAIALTVNARPFKVIGCPTMVGFAPKRRSQYR
jgi:hypothetical protein